MITCPVTLRDRPPPDTTGFQAMNGSSRRLLAFLWGLTSVAILCSAPLCRGQDYSELRELLDRFAATVDAEQFDDAERQAEYLLGVANKQLRDRPAVLADCYEVVGDSYEKRGRYAQAERYYAQQVKLLESAVGHWKAEVADALHELGDAIYYQKQYGRSAVIFRQALEIRQRVLGQKHLDTAVSWRDLGYAFYMTDEYDKAAQCYDQALAIRRQLEGEDSPLVANSIRDLANVRYYQLRYDDALPLYNRALALREKLFGAEHLDVAQSLFDRADCLVEMLRLSEAEADFRRGLEIRLALTGESTDAATAMRGLAGTLIQLIRYEEADELYKRALAIEEAELGANSVQVARCLDGMARIRQDQGRYAEAEPLHRRSLTIRERLDPPDPLALAGACNNLSTLYLDMGRYADAEKLARRSLALREEHLPPNDPAIATTLNNLGAVLRRQGRNREAEAYYRRALAIREERLSPNNPDVASSLQNLANLLTALEDYEQAEPLFLRALEIFKEVYGEEHVEVAGCNSVLADLYWQLGRKAEAQALYIDVLESYESQYGKSHPALAQSLYDLAWCYFYSDDLEEQAQALLDRAVDIDRQFPLSPQTAFSVYSFRARVHRYLGRGSEATHDLDRAIELAEQLRGSSAGAELERADFFSSFASAFETMVSWQMDDGDVERALAAIERSRARSLLDEISLSGADLNAGRPALEEEQQRQNEAELRSELTELERELQTILESPEPSAAERDRLTQEIAATREKLYQQYRDARSSSVIYQNLLNRTTKLPSLGEIQRHLLADRGLLFVYLLGEENGYLVTLNADTSELYSLEIGEDTAPILGCEPGPLTSQLLSQILLSDEGVMPQLASPQPGPELNAKLAALWTALVPEEFQSELIEGKCGRLLVVPNGPLAFLPFETLVTSLEPEAKYLLDSGPPVYYAPSVTVLDSLRIRTAASLPADREPVLTVGDPHYGEPAAAEAGARSVLLRGKLAALPNSGLESRWVSEVFGKSGVATARLARDEATEANVRAAASARRILHLACHGMTEQAHGNLFGALAFTPGSNPDEEPLDDGFLSLAEIYAINLRSCELAILSACETNYGPEQQGEGVWTLSRGFLVAGARRVVASNWVVDDEAAAHLVSYFCGGLAKAEAAGDGHAYGSALLAAKRNVRGQAKWQAPYYWASMVLIGPP